MTDVGLSFTQLITSIVIASGTQMFTSQWDLKASTRL